MRIIILTTRGGQGLISGSEAIKESLEKIAKTESFEIDVEIIDFFSENSIIGNLLTMLYNFFLRHSILLNSIYIKIIHFFRFDKIKFFYRKPHFGIKKLIAEKSPDAIILTSQYLVSPLGYSLKKELVTFPIFVGNLDPGTDCVPLWFSPDIDYHILPTPESLNAFLKEKIKSTQAIQGKLVVRQRFLDAGRLEKKVAREKLGLPMDPFTILITGSREGFWGVLPIIQTIIKDSNANIIVICGSNHALMREISMTFDRHRCMALGWRDDPEIFMRAADVIISKPGKQTMKESIAVLTPLISIAFPTVMEQEKGNLEVMKNRGVLLLAKSLQDIIIHINRLKDDDSFRESILKNLKVAKNDIDPDLVAALILKTIKDHLK